MSDDEFLAKRKASLNLLNYALEALSHEANVANLVKAVELQGMQALANFAQVMFCEKPESESGSPRFDGWRGRIGIGYTCCVLCKWCFEIDIADAGKALNGDHPETSVNLMINLDNFMYDTGKSDIYMYQLTLTRKQDGTFFVSSEIINGNLMRTFGENDAVKYMAPRID